MRLHVSLNEEFGYSHVPASQMSNPSVSSGYTHQPYSPQGQMMQPTTAAAYIIPPQQHQNNTKYENTSSAPNNNKMMMMMMNSSAPKSFNANTNTYNNGDNNNYNFSSPSEQQYVCEPASHHTSSSSYSHFGSSPSGIDDEVISVESSGTATSVAPTTHNSESRVRPMGTDRQLRGHVDPSRFKTETCSYHSRGQACPYSPFCAFAHGEEDRRSRRRNVREGVAKVNTLPRTLVYHEVWVQTTKYTRKTGPTESSSMAKGAAPPVPSFLKKKN